MIIGVPVEDQSIEAIIQCPGCLKKLVVEEFSEGWDQGAYATVICPSCSHRFGINPYVTFETRTEFVPDEDDGAVEIADSRLWR